MNLVRFPRVSTLLLIAGSAVVFGGNVLSAQVGRGHFTLPVETHWGSVVMAPGPYSYTLDRAAIGLIISVRPEGKASTLTMPFTGAVSTGETSKRSTLQLETEGGETAVRSIHFGHLGMTLYYRAPKAGAAHLIGQSDLKRQVSLSVAGG